MTDNQFRQRVQAGIDAAVAQGTASVDVFGDNSPEPLRSIAKRMDRTSWPWVASGYEDQDKRERRELVAANRLQCAYAAQLIRERKTEPYIERPAVSPDYFDGLREWADEHGEQRDEFGER